MIVGVIGSGSIGPDLAYGFVSALSRTPGAKVYLHDIKKEALDQGMERIMAYVKKGVARGKLSPKAAKGIESALTPTLELSDLKACSYVLEAASEDLPIKQKILAGLEAIVSADCLIGFATSGIPRREIAAKAKHPDRCFVNHPFYPAWRSLPVEIVLSNDAALGERMVNTMKRLGKVPVLTSDVECFAADDIFCNYISEAARIVEEGVATPAQVDRIVNDAIGGGGPFNVMDGTRGNLLVVKCQKLMQHAETGTPWYAPPAILEERGSELWHDRKNPQDSSYDDALKNTVMNRILAVLVARTYFVIDNKICEPTELNWMTRMALGFSKGTVELTEDLGAPAAKALCEAYAKDRPGFAITESVANQTLVCFRVNVTVERDGDVAVLKVFRPEVKNALSAKTIAEISATFDELAADDTVKGIVFSSYDGSLAGADITELAALPDAEACRGICMQTHPIMQQIEGLNKPVVAAVDGPVLGGGAEFSMACHGRVVGRHLMLGQPEVNLGIIPGYGGTQRLPRLIGLERANAVLRQAKTINADQACAWGWADGEPIDDPIAGAKALIAQHRAGKITLKPVEPSPMAVGAIAPLDIQHRSLTIDAILVDVMRRGLAMPLSAGLELEADGFARCKDTVDLDIGMKNFMQNGPRTPAVFLHE